MKDDMTCLMSRLNLIKIFEAIIFPPDSFDEYFEDDFFQMHIWKIAVFH